MSIIECGEYLYVFYDVNNCKYRFKKYKLDAIVYEEEIPHINNVFTKEINPPPVESTNQVSASPVKQEEQNNNNINEIINGNLPSFLTEDLSRNYTGEDTQTCPVKRKLKCSQNAVNDEMEMKKLKRSEKEEAIEFENDKKCEKIVINTYSEGKTICLQNTSTLTNGYEKYLFCTINGTRVQFRPDYAKDLLAIAVQDLNELCRPDVECSICNNLFKMRNTFMVNGDYVCLECSLTYDTMKDFVDPLNDDVKEITNEKGLFILCDRQRHYKSIGNFITYTKRRGFKYEKLCQYCRLKKQYEYKKKNLNKK